MIFASITSALRNPITENGKIFRAALVVGSMTIVVKLATAWKELTAAAWFGRADDIEAFLIAFLIPTFVVQLVASQFVSALIPTFISVRERKNHELTQRLLSSALILTLGALTAVAILMGGLAPTLLHYMGASFSATKHALTLRLFYALLPYVIVNGMVVVWSAVLNATGRFALPALSPIFTPAITCICIALLGGRLGVWSMVLGVLTGAMVEASVLGYFLTRAGYRIEFRWYGMTLELRQIARQYPPLFTGAFLASGGSLVDQAMAGMLVGGSIAAYAYGSRLTALVNTFVAMSLSTAVVPYFSAMVARQDWRGCRNTLKVYSRLILCATVPLTIILLVLAKMLVRLMFQHGAFSPSDTEVVARVHAMYCLQLPFFAIGIMYSRLLSAMQRNDVLMYTGACSLVLDVIFNLIFMRYMGVAGIALSTSVFVFVSVATKMFIVRRLLLEADTLSTTNVFMDLETSA
jgi:putative peptidoglycan lipid II flippase